MKNIDKELLNALALEAKSRIEHGFEPVANVLRAHVGDAFDMDTLSTAVARAEAVSHLDSRLAAARRYQNLIPIDNTTRAQLGTALVRGFTDAYGVGRPHAPTSGDIPLAGTTYSKQSITVKSGAVGYEYSIPELRSAMETGVPLSADKVASARLAHQRHMWKVAMTGEPETDTQGLLNHDIPEVTIASGKWATATIDNIQQDLSTAIGVAMDYADESGDTSMLPDTILLPSNLYRLINDRRISANSETSVLKYLTVNNLLTARGVQNVRIESLPELNKAGEDSGARAVIYRRDPSALELILPQDIEFLPAQAKDLNIYVPAWYLYAGLWIKSPKAVMYIDGIG